MSKFVNAMSNKANQHQTINGANAYKSTKSDLLDLFGTIGGMREKLDKVETDFAKAFAEDRLLATKLAFYARNIRGGLGERDIFRRVLKTLARISPETLRKNLKQIPHFGRWDDLFVLMGTSLEDDVVALVKAQINEDYESDNPSLLAKWMPSANASSKKTRKLAKKLIAKLNTTESHYRKGIVAIRKKINPVETQMSSGDWKGIEYGKVPAKAMNVYRNAFRRHDEDGFSEYVENLVKGTAKINASTLYPYEIIEKMGIGGGWRNISLDRYDEVLEQQWKALPNYVDGEQSVMVMADTSGSMWGRPLATALGLAVYFAQRNKGAFHNTFMTFSERPEFIQFKDGLSLYDTINDIPSIVANTNLERAFMEILDVAVNNGISQDELPKALVVVSDMGFDYMTTGNCSGDRAYNSMFEKVEKVYASHGYAVPNVVFWNVNDTNSGFQVACGKRNVQLASGQSPSVFKSIVNNIGKTPYQAMVDVLSDELYSEITV